MSGTPAAHHRRLVAAAATVVVVTALFLVATGLTTTGSSQAGNVAPSAADLRASLLKALAGSSADVLVIQRSSSIADGQALHETLWIAPSQPRPGGQVERRSMIMDANRSPVQDFETTYTMPAAAVPVSDPSVGIDAAGGTVPGYRVTGSSIEVDYPSRSWSEVSAHQILVPASDDMPALQVEIAGGTWTRAASSTVDGVRAIELVWRVAAANPVRHELWVDATTMLPLREIYTYPSSATGLQGTIESDYQLLAPSDATLAALSPPIPHGFTRVPAA